MSANEIKHPEPARVPPLADLPRKISSAGLVETRSKDVSLAVLLAILFGPFGLTYCTTTGSVVMLILSIILAFLIGNYSALIVLPICALWAWRAARETSSILD
jgi:hypothetical protein